MSTIKEKITETINDTNSNECSKCINTGYTNLNKSPLIKKFDSDDTIDNLICGSNIFSDNSDLYVVSVDNVPQFYVKDEKTASKKMWEVTRLLSSRHLCEGYLTQFINISENELHILGSYRFFLVAYDQVLQRVSYKKIIECV